MLHTLGQFLLHIANAGKGRETHAEQAQGQAGGVLVGAQPDHQQPKHRGQQSACAHARSKAQPVVAGVHHGREPGNGRAQHHALGAQVDHPGFFIDEQAQGRNRQHGASVQGGRDQECIGFHQATCPFRAAPALPQRIR